MSTKSLLPLQPGTEFGFLFGESDTDYHASGAVGNSSLKFFAEHGPARWKTRYIDKCLPARAESWDLTIGKALHCALLEPDAYGSRFLVKPVEFNGRATKWKDWKAKYEARGFTLLDSADQDLVDQMVANIMGHPDAVELLADKPLYEVTIRRMVQGLPVQVRPDVWHSEHQRMKLSNWEHDGALLVDIKTVDHLSGTDRGSWARNFHSYGYHRQAALYAMMAKEHLAEEDPHYASPLGTVPMVFIVVEKTPPHEVAVYVPTPAALAIGQREVVRDLGKLRRCIMDNNWRTAPGGVAEIDLPDWYVNLHGADIQIGEDAA